MRSRLPRSFRVARTVSVLFVASWTTLQLAGGASGRLSGFLLEATEALAAIAAAVACGMAARLTAGASRRSWRLIGAGSLCWGLGQSIWAAYELGGNAAPFPSFADLGYLCFPVLVAAGLILRAVPAKERKGRLRALLDGVMIAASAFIVTWVVVLQQMIDAGAGENGLATVVGLAYPVSDAVLVTLVAYVIMRRRQESRALPGSILYLGSAMIAMFVADTGFAYLTLTDPGYDGSSVVESSWIAAFVLIFLAGMHRTTTGRQFGGSDDALRPYAQFVPYAALVVAAATTGVMQHDHVDGVTLIVLGFLLLALMTRQVLTLQENRALTTDLERRVADRTAALEGSERRFRALVQRSSDVVVVLDANGVVTYVTDSVTPVFGFAPEDIAGRPATQHVVGDHIPRLQAALADVRRADRGGRVIEVEVRHGNGTVRQAEVTITNLLDEASVEGYVLNVRDVSDQRALEARLLHDAFHDSLTGLPNRSLLSERLAAALASGPGDVAILFVDVDEFKRVNDTLGHVAGDALLCQIGDRLRACVRPGETVARLGGDEFAILLDGVMDADAPRIVAERICDAMRRPVRIGGREILVGASVGVAIAGRNGDESRLMQSADLAMYRAKARKGGGYVVYDPTMHSEYAERVQLEEDLRRAIVDGDLRVYYQPVFDLSSGRMLAAEALVRWKHPVRGIVPPGDFIALAEESGLIHGIGRYVLAEAMRQMVSWRTRGAERLRVSVNISAAELRGTDLVDFVREHLESSGLPPESLVLEITESILIEHTEENIETLRKLKALGVQLALDDFGTGYSSLSYLHRFPVDILKVDRSFVERLGAAESDTEFVRSIVGLGQSLGLVTVAEGIETQAQWDALIACGCELGQGMIFAMPLPPEDVDRRLSEWTAVRSAPTGGATLRGWLPS